MSTHSWTELTGLNTNVSKSKVMHVNSNNKQITRAAGVETEDANKFIYIGGTVNIKGGTCTVPERYQMETGPCKNCLQQALVPY